MRSVFVWLLAMVPAVAGAQAVIRVDPGPGGNPRISTPWGDYVAIRQGGALFVITEEQYAKGLIDGYAHSKGQEAVNVAGAGKTYISKADISVQGGAVRLRQVEATIVIGVPADKKLGRPPKPKTSEYVQVMWLQQQAGKVSPVFAVGGQMLKPNNCGVDMGMHHCEFTVSHAQLVRPAAFIFTQQGLAPGLWEVDSLTRVHAAGIQRKYDELKMPISGEDAADLQAVARIDPSINAEGSKHD